MNKKLIVASLGAVLSFGAFADEAPAPQTDAAGGRGNIMANLTDEQKSCIEAYNCAKMEKPEKGAELTAEQKEAKECITNAMKSCGVEMPKRPEGKKTADGEEKTE